MKRTASMRPRYRILSIAGFVLAAAVHFMAADIRVIANPSVKTNTISAKELRGVFLLQRKILKDGSAVEPVLQKSGSTHERFLHEFLNRDGEEMNIYYQGLVFTGKASVPKQLNSDAEVVAYVARTRGAIGYTSDGSSTEGVKILTVGSEESRKERFLLTRVEPEYPETLQRLHISGTVRLELTISPKGNVEGASIVGGNPILAENAVKAAKQWVYSPASSRSTLQVTIPFEAKP
jgi:TonB family protein